VRKMKILEEGEENFTISLGLNKKMLMGGEN
jgi:hypothetical protein